MTGLPGFAFLEDLQNMFGSTGHSVVFIRFKGVLDVHYHIERFFLKELSPSFL